MESKELSGIEIVELKNKLENELTKYSAKISINFIKDDYGDNFIATTFGAYNEIVRKYHIAIETNTGNFETDYHIPDNYNEKDFAILSNTLKEILNKE